jgi:hypothetical protein
MTFGFAECAGLAAWIAFIFMPVYRHHKEGTSRMMMWKMLYLVMGALLVVTAFYFTKETPVDTWQLILGFVVFVIHVVVGKMYCGMKSSLDQKYRNVYFLVYMLVMVATAAAFYVALCVDGQGLYLVAVGCFSAYIALFLAKSIYKHFFHTRISKDGYTQTGDSIMRRTPLLPHPKK